ncbi:MAG: hypothetical protein EDQ89_01000 [Acidobacteria bacterium]|nr:MAG: hypothetical protein EDQ89_01000 [Acidobacteriota bacterium]MCL4286492.1 hypothetical protein [Thermoleophilia bacterium]
MRLRTTVALLAAALATLTMASAAGAAIKDSGMRDTRYCEIFTVFLSPAPIARINNSYGLNNCRQGWWESLDAAALADEAGADLVLLNGPRYWLMDRVSVTDPGPVSTLGGKRMREVATIDLARVGLAPPPPFTTVRIQRDTRFVFRAGRRIFELTDPDGRRWVMQSYARIVDPGLRYRQLRGLGREIGLPAGWTYRARKPKRNLVLRARGQATIVQDALKNTYQRIPR